MIRGLLTSRLDFNNSLLARYQPPASNVCRLCKTMQQDCYLELAGVSTLLLPLLNCIDFQCFRELSSRCCQLFINACMGTIVLNIYKKCRCLRSSYDVTKLNVKVSCRTDGDRSFSVLAPKLWNSLPLSLRITEDNVIFRKQLKTYLFKRCYAFT